MSKISEKSLVFLFAFLFVEVGDLGFDEVLGGPVDSKSFVACDEFGSVSDQTSSLEVIGLLLLLNDFFVCTRNQCNQNIEHHNENHKRGNSEENLYQKWRAVFFFPIHVSKLTKTEHIGVVKMTDKPSLTSRSHDGKRACEGQQYEHVEEEECSCCFGYGEEHIDEEASLTENAKEVENFNPHSKTCHSLTRVAEFNTFVMPLFCACQAIDHTHYNDNQRWHNISIIPNFAKV